MKLLYVTPYYVPAWRYGGPPQCIADLASQLASRHGFNITVITLNANGPDRLFDDPKTVIRTLNGVTVYYLPRSANFLGHAYFYSPAIEQTLKQFDSVDLIHVHTLFNAFSRKAMQFAVNNAVPFILTPHGMLSDYSLRKSYWTKKIHRFMFDDNLLTHAYAVHFTAEGEAARAVMDKRIRKEIIPIGFQFDQKDGFQKRNENPVLRLMFLGRLHPIKGLEPFIQALAKVDKRIAGRIHLDLFGGDEDNYLEQLQMLVNSLGMNNRVTFCGPLSAENKAAAFQNHDVLVLTSYHENFGMAAAEAMAAGMPVLISDQVSLAPFVEKHRCGWITTLEENHIRQKIETVFNTTLAERNDMGRRAFESVRSNFNMVQVAQQFAGLYRQAVSDHI